MADMTDEELAIAVRLAEVLHATACGCRFPPEEREGSTMCRIPAAMEAIAALFDELEKIELEGEGVYKEVPRDLRGWTEEENAEHQRRAAVIFDRYVGQPLTDYALAAFKSDMLEDGIPVEDVGIAVVNGAPALTVIFEHKQV